MSRLGTSRGKAKVVEKTPAEMKKEKQLHEFQFNSDEAKAMRGDIRQMRAEIENETRLLNDFQQQKVSSNRNRRLLIAQRWRDAHSDEPRSSSPRC
jgi:hypothetical protein